jgi:pyrroline-5-carboxylate reductase
MIHLILGAGNMVSALIPPYIEKAKKRGHKFLIYTPSGKSAQDFAAKYDIEFVQNLSEVDSVDILWLGMKPQQVSQASETLSHLELGKSKVISLLAGTDYKRLSSLFKTNEIIRIMPNTPSKVGFGVNALWISNKLSKEFKEDFLVDFESSGRSFVLNEEDEIDLITPYSGSGPAYFFEIVRILSDDLHRRGLDKKMALDMVTLTMQGAAEMILKSDDDPLTLRKNVTSKGGVTFEALKVLEENKLSTIMEEAIDAALKRNTELKGE